MEPVLRFQDDVLSVVTWDRMLFNRWYGPVTKRHVIILRDKQRAHREQVGRLVVMSHIEARTGLAIEDGARRIAVDFVNEFQQDIVCLGQVASGQGFHSSAVRAILAGVQLLGRAGFPMSVFPTVDKCSEWLLKHWHAEFPDADPNELMRGIERVPETSMAHAS